MLGLPWHWPESKTLAGDNSGDGNVIFRKIAGTISYCVLVLIFLAILLLAYLPDFRNPAFGAEAADDSQQALMKQVDEIGKRLSEVENRLNALVNNRLPQNLEFCGERVPQERGYVRERLEKEVVFINRKQFTLYIKRSEKYFPYIEKRLKEWKMPDCLKYIAVIESALLPNALSSAKAYGPWQFMPETARRYGLKQGLNWDERANFEKATDAALSYFWDNYKQFGNWALAIAAYNAGEDAVQSAINHQKTKDYYELWLPQETMQYNYRAIVAYLVMSRSELFGFSFKDSDLYQWPDTEETTVKIQSQRSVIDIALHLKVSVNELLWLNPWVKMPTGRKSFKQKLNNFVLPKGTYTFKIPKRLTP